MLVKLKNQGSAIRSRPCRNLAVRIEGVQRICGGTSNLSSALIKRSVSMRFSSPGRFAVGLLFALFGACFLLGTYARPKPAKPAYHLIKTISLPPAPGGSEYFDYITVDADARRVYISHGTEVVVLNADDYSVVGRITGMGRSHGVAVVKDLGKGYVSDGSHEPVVQKI